MIVGEVCFGTETSNIGIISAPDFDVDGYYDYNIKCTWAIQVASNTTIMYQLHNLSIETTPGGCDADYLRLYVSLNT